jgi:cytidylate kinase
LAENDDSWDKEVDTRQIKLALESNGCVLGSRLAIWMLKEANLKIYLQASPEIRAKRILNREGESPESLASFTASRDKKDHDRYSRIYGIDNDSYQFADMIINTDDYTPTEISAMIVKRVNNN